MSSNQFGDIKSYLEKGAIVLDVRTVAEYEDGHVKGSAHIVLDDLEYEIDQLLDLDKPIITCCRSGARSERAKELLLTHGLDAINGGPWENVESYL
ncbi:MAG: rhodanese-like domain-containing protein [Winogradskyella sp.]|uniref:rhodanese-like domain-containing protein n=1 Tax=Winogradskyella sp. TaxID=1883156 RepID=UPI000F3E3C4C|nr:rhodanese-like domain-containing protein [Winogradskyella sp.]RNC84193.1 MAG: rhodanese-like domain-containing protein [Winogradskyella sp.]